MPCRSSVLKKKKRKKELQDPGPSTCARQSHTREPPAETPLHAVATGASWHGTDAERYRPDGRRRSEMLLKKQR